MYDPLGRTPLHLLAASRFHQQPLWMQAEEQPLRCSLLSTMELLYDAPWAKYTTDLLGQTPLMEASCARAPNMILRMLGGRPNPRRAHEIQPQLQCDRCAFSVKAAAGTQGLCNLMGTHTCSICPDCLVLTLPLQLVHARAQSDSSASSCAGSFTVAGTCSFLALMAYGDVDSLTPPLRSWTIRAWYS